MKLKQTALALAVLAALGATSATAAEDERFNVGVALSSVSIGSATSDGILYQAVLDYKFFEKDNVELLVEGRLGSSSAASSNSPSTFGTVKTEIQLDTTYSVFLKTKNKYDGFNIYGLLGYTSSSATATASLGNVSASASATSSDFSYGVGMSKDFGNLEVGAEFIQYHGDTSGFGLMATKSF